MRERDNSLMFFGLLVTSLVYLAVRPVRLPCIGCDTGGLFYRCMDGTGLNSITCEAWTKGIAGTNAVRKQIMTVSEYSSELIKFASHLPQHLYDFANMILAKVREIAAEVYVRLRNVAAIAQQKMKEAFQSLKNVVLDSWEAVYDKVINPVLSGLMKYVLEPVSDLMGRIVAFAKMVIDGVSNMLDKGGKIVSAAYDAVYKAGEALSESVEFVMKKTAQIIENVVDGIRTGLNKGLAEVVGAAESSVNALSNSVGAVVSGMETALNKTIQGTTYTLEKGVNSVGKGIDDVVGAVQTGINSGLKEMAGVAQRGIDEVTGGVEDGVNALGDGIIGGLGDVLDETEKIVNDLGNVLEGTVNDTIGLINTGLISPIESTINSSADVVQSALNGIMVPVRSITGALDKIANVSINLKPIYDGKPFSFLDAVSVPDVPKIGKLNINDIKNISIKDASIPGIRYVRPSGAKPLGRQRLQASIERAQKNWQYALGQSTGKYPYEKARCHDAKGVRSYSAQGVKSVGLEFYGDQKSSHTYEFLPPLGDNSDANDTVSQMRRGITPTQAARHVTKQKPMGAAGHDVKQNPTGAAKPPASNDIIVKGVAIPKPKLPDVPSVSLAKPGLKVSIKADPIVIPKPPKNPVNLKAPQVQFDVEIDSKVPQVPNVVQGIQDGIGKLGDLLSRFFKPVWSAYATVVAMANSTIAMVFHFFQEEITWQKIYGGVMVALKRGWQGVKEIADIVYNEVILPFVDVLIFLKEKIVWAIREFASMTMDFLGDIVKGVQDLGEAVWNKVKPALKQAVVVTSGVAMYSLSQLIEGIPGMNLLPATSTTKLYMVLVVLVLFLVGYQVKFIKDFVSGFLKIALVPVIELDKAFDKYVRNNVPANSALARVAGIR